MDSRVFWGVYGSRTCTGDRGSLHSWQVQWHHVSRTLSQRQGWLSHPAPPEKQDFSQCPGRMNVQGFDFLCSRDKNSQTLLPAECRQLLAFPGLPGSSSLLQQIHVLCMDSEQNYSNTPNSEALSGSLLHFCKLLHPLLKYSLFLTICSAYCSHSICSRHIRPSQLLYNYPAATLKLQQVFLTHHVPEGNNPTLIQSLANSNNSKTCT